MPIPAYPTHFIPRPFAANGTFQVIPDAKAAEGRASWQEGFPVETQLPLNQGGVAPARPDFNGAFNALSALACWQQTGGLFLYSAARDYNTPAMVVHENMLWFCKAPNGPDTTVGAIAPGSNAEYWISFLEFLASGGGGGGSSVLGVPVGTIIMFHGTTPPEGFFACNGGTYDTVANPQLFALLGSANLPDYRGLVPRGYDPAAVRDPDGAGRAIGSVQQDAMQPITGTMGGMPLKVGAKADAFVFSGALYKANSWGQSYTDAGGRDIGVSLGINSALVTRTAPETRMRNVCVLFAIKHD